MDKKKKIVKKKKITDISWLEFVHLTIRYALTEVKNIANTKIGQKIEQYIGGYARFVSTWGKRSITVAVASLIIGVLAGVSGADGIARIIITIGFMFTTVTWLIIFAGGSIITRVYSATSGILKNTKLEGIYLPPQSASDISRSMFLILSWLMVTTLYTSFVPVWNDLRALVWLIPLSIALALIPYGFGIKPNPRTYRFIYSIVLILFLGVSASFFFTAITHAGDIILNPSNSDKAYLDYEERKVEKEDKKEANLIKSAAKKLETGKELTKEEKQALEEVRERMEDKGLFKKVSKGISGVLPWGKDASADEAAVAASLPIMRAGQTVWEQTLVGQDKVFNTPVQLDVGAGIFVKNYGPAKVKICWAEYDAELDPGQRYALNFLPYRPGATIKFQVTGGDSARVAIMS